MPLIDMIGLNAMDNQMPDLVLCRYVFQIFGILLCEGLHEWKVKWTVDLFFDEPVQRVDEVVVLVPLEMSDDSLDVVSDWSGEVYDAVGMRRMTCSRGPFSSDFLMVLLQVVNSSSELFPIDGAIIDDSNLKTLEPSTDLLLQSYMLGLGVPFLKMELDGADCLLLLRVVG
jgi:hypothetical protein